MDMTDFEKWVYTEFRINLSAYKPKQLHRRINSLMSRAKATTLEAYVDMLRNDPLQRQRFLDFITINVTEFFRNPKVFDEFSKQLAEYIKNCRHQLRIWSAACSNGAEPYSIAILLDGILENKNYSILATDIDNTILKRAMNGSYDKSELKNVSCELIRKYFSQNEGKCEISQELKKMITFARHDLILDDYEKNFDIIVCRNVTIYLNDETKEDIYRKFSSSLKKGGLLFVGATESMFNYRQMGFEKTSAFIYRKL